MGREIRKVKSGWMHPKDDRGQYIPLLGASYTEAVNEWIKEYQLWEANQHPGRLAYPEYRHYAQYAGDPPVLERYMPDWPDAERTHICMYETVSDGTPVTPVFATPGELVDYLCTKVDYWRSSSPWERANAEAFVAAGWAPSMVVVGGKITEAGGRKE